jgi:probable rRNA maturation factor
VAGLSEPSLDRFIGRAKRAARLGGTVTVLVTTSRDLRALNNRFRGKDKATDVLSFPPIHGSVQGFAGDIAISADIAAQNARQLGHSVADEIRVLALHGVLHLAGYDHENDHGEMARTEQRLRKSLGLPVTLMQRISKSEGESGRASSSTRSAITRQSQVSRKRIRTHFPPQFSGAKTRTGRTR